MLVELHCYVQITFINCFICIIVLWTLCSHTKFDDQSQEKDGCYASSSKTWGD